MPISRIDYNFKTAVDLHLHRIANLLLLNGNYINNLGLLNGKMGVAIFFYHYSVYTRNNNYLDLVKELVEEIFQEINSETPVDFANGLTGIGWGIEYLFRKGIILDRKDATLSSLDKKIYQNSLTTPLLLVNKEDICSYGLYYLSRLDEFKDDCSLESLVIKQLLVYLHDNCERMMLCDNLFGFEVPKLTLNQLNSLVFFLCKVQHLELFPIKIAKLESYLPQYIRLKVTNSFSIIENFTLKKLLEIFKSNINNNILINEYDNIIYSIGERARYHNFYEKNLVKELNVLAWYSLIYPIEYKSCENIDFMIESIFNELDEEIKWELKIDSLCNGEMGLNNGLAGQGLALLHYSNFKAITS
jgi:hypothetical protein